MIYFALIMTLSTPNKPPINSVYRIYESIDSCLHTRDFLAKDDALYLDKRGVVWKYSFTCDKRKSK